MLIIFEMILNRGVDGSIKRLFFCNNEENRNIFLKQIEDEILDELKSSLLNENNKDLINFYSNIYYESYSQILAMKSDFLRYGQSKYGLTSLLVEERVVI